MPAKEMLDPNAILTAEFNYIAQTAFQSHEDRARVPNYYLLTAATAIAAILTVRVESATPWVYLGFALVFAALSIIGLLTVLQLARLRVAWFSAARAMNRIKSYYQTRCPDVHLEEAFAWTDETLPRPQALRSMAFLLALSVILVDGAMVAACAAFLGVACSVELLWLWVILGVAIAVGFALLQLRLYKSWIGG